MIRAVDFYKYSCCDLIEDPEYFLFGDRDATLLPESIAVYNKTVDRLNSHFLRLSSSVLIGERLRKARKKQALTGDKVVQLWEEQADENGDHCTTTTATISNHEKGKVSSIKLLDLLRYCYIYEETTPNEIMLGCSFAEFVNNATLSLHQRTALDEEDMLLGEQYSDHLHQLLMAMTKGHCERCGQPAPFYYKDGVPCLFLKALSEGPSLTNSVVLCPNCYMRIEKLEEPEEIEALREKASNHSLASLYSQTQQ